MKINIVSAVVLAAGLAIVFAGTPAAQAHDFWIEPSTFRPAVNDLVQVSLRVGEHFKGDPVVRDAAKIERFVIADSAGEQPVLGQDGGDSAGLVRPATPGVYVLGYRSKESRIELEAHKFETYLREEGLEAISAARKERGESSKPGRERYSRCAKALLAAGEGPEAGFNRALGFTLELIPEKCPYTSLNNQSLPVRILYEGNPLAGAHVVAVNRAEPDRAESAKSNSEGYVEFKLPRAGVWMIKAVHMVRAPHGADADWTSYWATLTFERP